MTNLYEELEAKKKSGVELSWDDITYNDLKQMYIEENCSANMIADLYDIKQGKVRTKLSKWDISIRNATMEKVTNDFGELYHKHMLIQSLEDGTDYELESNDKDILISILSLPEENKKAIIAELIISNPYLTSLKNDAMKYRANMNAMQEMQLSLGYM